ncbi:MAG: helix-turn-helix transcriptional regulator [Gemmatimonadaceae bacterium]|jgi:transcriptional regulator
MDARKRKRLEADGWRFGSYADFLNLTDAEVAIVELRASLAAALKARRVKLGVTQVELAQRLKSSQSRVAKMEAGNPTVSFELLMRALLVLGASRRDLSAVIR